MGYKNEYASSNQYNDMRDYLDEYSDDIFDILNKSEDYFKELEKKPIEIVEVSPSTAVPAVSFDGGLATVFGNKIGEIKIIKVAGGTALKNKGFKFSQEFFHIYTGLIKWPQALNLKQSDLLEKLVKHFTSLNFVKIALDELSLDKEEFSKNLFDNLVKKKGKNVEDVIREFMEWFLLVNFVIDNKGKNFLIIKDGSLYPSSFVVGQKFVEDLYSWVDSKKIKIVGLVKSSRFLNQDNAWSKPILARAKEMKKTSFFKIPPELEKKIDRDFDKNRFERYFVSLYKGTAVFECQFAFNKNKKQIMEVMAGEVSLKYGGCIITNSYAHMEASLSEREALALTESIRRKKNG